MEWLIWMLVAFVLFRVIGFSCPRSRIGSAGHLDTDRLLSSSGGEWRRRGAWHHQRRARPGPLQVGSSESPMEALQRRFVDGRITVEQYEAELDRLFARSGRAAGNAPVVH